MIQGLSHISYIVEDLERTSHFLKKVFEAKEVYSSDEKQYSYSKEKYFLVDGLWFAIMEGEPLPERTYSHVALKAAETDLEEYIDKAAEIDKIRTDLYLKPCNNF